MSTRDQTKSGNFVLRTSPELHSALAQKASTESVSLNELCNQLLKNSLQESSHSSTIPSSITEELQESYSSLGLQAIILFGSFARGTHTPNSDIDLLMVMDSTTPIQRDLYRKWDHAKINLHFTHFPQDPNSLASLWLEVLRDGRLIWSRESLFRSQFETLKNVLYTGAYIRKETQGQPYWVRKEITAS